MYFSFSCYINNTPTTELCVLLKERNNEKLFGNDYLFVSISSGWASAGVYVWNGTGRGESTYYSLSAVLVQPKQSELWAGYNLCRIARGELLICRRADLWTATLIGFLIFQAIWQYQTWSLSFAPLIGTTVTRGAWHPLSAHRREDSRKKKRKGARRGEIKACSAKGDWRAWDGKVALMVRSVVLYGAEADSVLLMGYHPQRQGGKVQAAEIKAVTSD